MPPLARLLVLLVAPLAFSTGRAAECNSTEIGMLVQAGGEITDSVDCSLGTTDSSSTADYCEHNACVQFMADVITRMPDCEYEGTNYYEELNLTLSLCEINNCTASDLAEVEAFTSEEAETSSDCSVSSIAAGRTTYSDVCDNEACVEYLTNVTTQLPDCFDSDGNNVYRSVRYIVYECDTAESSAATTEPEATTETPSTTKPETTTVPVTTTPSSESDNTATPAPTTGSSARPLPGVVAVIVVGASALSLAWSPLDT